jgi:hypothetical protein
MGISEGFRRLSILSGLMGFLAICTVYGRDRARNWDGSKVLDGQGYALYGGLAQTVSHRLLMVLLLVAIPVSVTLLVGWVVEGFRKK